MKTIFAIIIIIALLITWNHVPYSYSCYDNPITGCVKYDFWWKIPYDWSNYMGIKWSSYFTTNIVATVIIFWVMGKLLKK